MQHFTEVIKNRTGVAIKTEIRLVDWCCVLSNYKFCGASGSQNTDRGI